MTNLALDPVAFDSLHAEYAPRVLAYLRKFVGDSEAQDLTQEVFLKAYRGWSTFRGQCKESTWIFQIATHAALDRLRSPRAPLISWDPEGLPQGHPGPSTPGHGHHPLQQEMCRCIRDLVKTLPTDYRAIIHLSELKELRLGEIAEILGITPGAAKIRLHRARRVLKERMERDCRILLDERAEIQCDRLIREP